jgi:hypothetical protein
MPFILFLIALPIVASGQFTYTLERDVPVIQGNDTLLNAWAGGFNAGQINTMDVNGDNRNDLILYDRMAQRVMVFLFTGSAYRHAPEYETYFPEGITNWMLLRDFNRDGKKDLFTGDVFGIKVFKNTTPPGQPPTWEQVMFNTGFGTKSHVLLTKGFSGKVNLQLNFDDMPAIRDADGDGDLDIFCPRYPTGSQIEFHKNFAMERYGTADSLDFERITQNWGQVTDCTCGVFAFNNNPCNASGRTMHAGGKSLEMIDADGDGNPDLLFSESECNRVYLLRNQGTLENPVIQSATPFPPGNPIFIFPYPAAYLEDIDGDGLPDVLGISNAYRRDFTFSNFRESVFYYRNIGNATNPQWEFVQPNFLQHTMLDVGDNAVPVFYDIDGDGDLDMLIGHYAYNERATLIHYENTGTPSSPVFRKVTDDFAYLSLLNFTNIRPSLADMNGDGRIDLVFTASDPSGFNTQLYFIPNSSTTGLSVNLLEIRSLNFSVFSNENVALADVNEDGKPDLLIGRSNGALQYWENTGTPQNPSFTLKTSAWLGLGASVLRQSPRIFVADLNADGADDLLMGDQTGILAIVEQFRETEVAEPALRNLVFNALLETYTAPNLGGRLWPVAANLFNTERPAIVMGTITGGLVLLRPDNSPALPEVPIIQLYPNPVERGRTLFVRTDRSMTLTLHSPLGQILSTPITLRAFTLYPLDTSHLQPGMYLFRFTVGGKKNYVRRVVVQ